MDLVGYWFLMYTPMFTTFTQNTFSSPCPRIMFQSHSMIVLAHFATPFCCEEYGLVVCWIPHSTKNAFNFLDVNSPPLPNHKILMFSLVTSLTTFTQIQIFPTLWTTSNSQILNNSFPSDDVKRKMFWSLKSMELCLCECLTCVDFN